MAINLSTISQYFQYPDKVAELKNRLYLILKNKGIEVTANESLNSLIEKVREVEPALEPQTIYLTQNNTSYDVTEYTEAVVNVPPVTIENDLDGLIDGSLSSFTMPSTVSKFATERFTNFSQLSTVVAPEINYIPSKTFLKCISLESINLPNVTIVESEAFKDCLNLSELNLEKAYYIGSSAFQNCIKLANLNLPNVRRLYYSAFNNCISLSQINLPNARLIAGSVFYKNAIEDLTLPNVTYVYDLYLGSCSKLKQISLPKLIKATSLLLPAGLLNTTVNLSLVVDMSAIANTSAGGVFNSWPNLESINWPLLSSLTISPRCYLAADCPGVSTINLPRVNQLRYGNLVKNLTRLSYININNLCDLIDTYGSSTGYVIDNCGSLTDIDCSLLNNLPSYFMRSTAISELKLGRASSMSRYALTELPQLKHIYAPTMKSIAAYAITECDNLTAHNFDSLNYIGSYAFEGCGALSTPIGLVYPSIENYAFAGCHNLSEIYLNTASTTVTGLSSYAFENCGILENASGAIYVPSAKLSSYMATYSKAPFSDKFKAFDSSYESNRVFAYEFYNSTFNTIPSAKNSAKIIYDYGFGNCTKLSGNISLESVEHIGDNAFIGLGWSGSNISFNLPKCKTIGRNAFYNLRSHTEFSLPQVEYIGPSAFYHTGNSYYYKSFYIPNVKYIGEFALAGISYYYPHYYSITLLSPNLGQLEYLGSSAFKNINVYVSGNILSLPKLSQINQSTFYSTGGSALSIYAPNIEYIGDGAFMSCSALRTLVTSKLAVVGYEAFRSCKTLTSIDSLYECKVIASRAFMDCTSLSVAIDVPNLISLGSEAFASTKITSFNAPELLTVAYSCFASCAQLQSIYMPKIDQIYPYQFFDCSKLSDLTLDFNAISSIGSNAFWNCNLISSLSLPNVTSVGEAAFARCSALTNLVLNDNYSIIERSTFASCFNLNFDNLKLEEKTAIGPYAFSACYQLKAITNKYLISVSTGTFANCSNISIINLPNVFTLESYAFSGCNKLASLSIRYSLIDNIPDFAFANCSSLSNIYFDRLSSIGQSCFYGCRTLEQFDLVNVTQIPSNAFNLCTNLSSINLSKITTIHISAFANCKELSYVDLANIQSIHHDAFNGCSKLNISIPNLSTIEASTYQSTAVASIINSSVNVIKTGAFANCVNLSEVSLVNVLELGESAFAKCINLSSVYIPHITKLSNYTFASTAIYSLPEELDTQLYDIPAYCFYGCVNLSTVSLSTLSKVGTHAFGYCKNIQSVSLENIKLLSYLASSAFAYCNSLTVVNLPNITTLRSFRFSGQNYTPLEEDTNYRVFTNTNISLINAPKCSQFGTYIFGNVSNTLETLNLPNCTSVWNGLANQIKLRSVNLERLDSILPYFFSYDRALENVNISRAIYIGTYAFANCANLTQINIPSVTTIETRAFYNCSLLSTVQLGIVTKIGDEVFRDCCNLDTLNCEVVDIIDNYAFENCNKLTSIIATACNYGAFTNCSNLSKVVLLTNSSSAISNFSRTFGSTPMLNSGLLGYYGSIYVPQSMLNYYRLNYSSYSARFGEIDSAMMNNYILAYNYYSGVVSLSELNTNAKYILNNAFKEAILSDCSSLALNKVKYIGINAFYSCSTLASLEASNCEVIGNSAFAYCSSLSTVSLPKVYSIGPDTFYGCSNLKILSLPNLVGSFVGFNGLEELYLSKADSVNVSLASSLKILSAPKATYWSGPTNAQISYLNLPQLSYLKADSSNLAYGVNLQSAQLASEIDYFNVGASFVYFKEQALQGRKYGTFIMSRITTIGSYMLSQASIDYAEFLNATIIGDYTFNSATIGSISLPKVKTINSYAFNNASLATNLSLPEVTYLANYALQGLHGCSELVFPKLLSCGQYAFRSASIQTLKFNAKVNLGATNTYALGGASVTNMVFNNDIANFSAAYQFAQNSNLTRVVFTKDILNWGTWYDMNTVFMSTPLSQSSYHGHFGSIYVPASLLKKYQTIFSSYYSRITTIEAHETELRALGLID